MRPSRRNGQRVWMLNETAFMYKPSVVHPDAVVGDYVIVDVFSCVGPTAMIGDGTHVIGAIVEGTVGRDCRLWRQAHVWAGAVIGDRCMLGQGVMVARATVGNNVRIQNGSTIPHGAIIEDDVYIGAGVRLCNSVHPSATREDELVPIILRKGCSIGSNACIVGRVEIGEGAVVGAGAVVTRDVPAGHKAIGVPALVFAMDEMRDKTEATARLILPKLGSMESETLPPHESRTAWHCGSAGCPGRSCAGARLWLLDGNGHLGSLAPNQPARVTDHE